MRAVFDKEELSVLLRDFYELTGLRTVVFDEWGMDILSYPPELPAYCRLVRRSAEGEQGCRLCDQMACTRWYFPWYLNMNAPSMYGSGS